MAIEIIKQGSPKAARRYQATCRDCDAVFTFSRSDARESPDQRDNGALGVKCPTELCGKEVWVHPNQGRYVGPG